MSDDFTEVKEGIQDSLKALNANQRGRHIQLMESVKEQTYILEKILRLQENESRRKANQGNLFSRIKRNWVKIRAYVLQR